MHRIWEYVSYVVANTLYLGDWSERPSEQRTRHVESEKSWSDNNEGG